MQTGMLFFTRIRLLVTVAGLLFVTGASAAAVDCARMAVLDYASHDGTVENLRRLFRAGQFAQLDEALDCLHQSPRRFTSGRTGASAVYWLFRREMPAPGTTPEASNAMLAWKKQRPQSMFVRFGELRVQYGTAWNARGSDLARNVPEEGWRLFHEALGQVEQAILALPSQMRNSPIFQNLLLAVVLDMPKSRVKPLAVFEEGVRRWPEYYDFYEVSLTRLGPMWGGSWEAVDQFIAHWSKHLSKTEGDSMYARLYLSVIAAGARVRDTRISWPRLRASLDDLVSRYPDPVHKNLAASYACGFQDVAYLKVALQRIRPEELAPASWLQGTDPESCMRLAGMSSRP